MRYKNISNRTIRVINVILKPNEMGDFPEAASHVKTFVKMKWLTPVEELVKTAPVAIKEEAPVVVAVEEAPAVVTEEAPAVVTEDSEYEHKRGKGKKGKQ